jgi:hypothetical protein
VSYGILNIGGGEHVGLALDHLARVHMRGGEPFQTSFIVSFHASYDDCCCWDNML